MIWKKESKYLPKLIYHRVSYGFKFHPIFNHSLNLNELLQWPLVKIPLSTVGKKREREKKEASAFSWIRAIKRLWFLYPPSLVQIQQSFFGIRSGDGCGKKAKTNLNGSLQFGCAAVMETNRLARHFIQNICTFYTQKNCTI